VISEIEEVLANVKPSVATVMTLIDENVRGVANADVVLLGCKPYMLSDIISSPQMRSILKKRTPVLISLLGGVTEHQVAEMIYSRSSKDSCPPDSPLQSDVTNIVRAMPNISARMRASMTIISPIKSLSVSAVATSLFRCVGKVKVLPSSLFDPATALCASGPALFASVIQAFIDGAVEIGIGKDDAVELTVETMRSTIDLLSPGGMTSHDLITRVATKGGATEKGLKVMKEAKSRDILIQTLAAVSFAMHGLGSRPE
jgi:pyrroline-5-carboxylate reductase